jgi:eukaryotic-like serine/threonine-protein kinase
MRTAAASTDWELADQALDRLLDVEPEHRIERLRAMQLSAPVRLLTERLLNAHACSRGPLDSGIPVIYVDAANALSGLQLGRWQLGAELDRGGMSVVYAAHALDQPEQLAAIKVLNYRATDQTLIRRFLDERSLQARLNHPFIVNFIEAGQTEDKFWLAMGQVNGLRIDHWCTQNNLSIRQRVALLIEVCKAISHAHSQLVIHRDIKPSNIMIETASALPKVLDFGIAELLGEGLSEQARGALSRKMLTPNFAAPEQFEAATASVAMDVYGLGALLHQLLFDAPPKLQAKPAAQHQTKRVADDMQSILQKALAADPTQRYPSVDLFAQDLHAWLKELPVQAHPASKRYRFSKYFGRHRVGVIAAAIAVGALLLGTSLALWQARVARSQAVIAKQAQHDAEQAQLLASERAENAQVMRDFALGLFEATVPNLPPGETPSTEQLLNAGLLRARSATALPVAIRADMLLSIASIFQRRQLLAKAEPILLEAQALIETMPATEEQIVLAARALTQLGKHALETGNAALSRARYERAFELLRPANQAHLRWFVLNSEMAWERIYAGAHQSAYEILKPLMASPHFKSIPVPEQIALISTLAVAAKQLGELDFASSLNRQTEVLRKQVFGDRHLSTAVGLANAGSLEIERGDFARAQANLSEAITIYDAIASAPMDYRGAAFFSMARLSLAQGDDAQALVWFERSHQERARYGGIDVAAYPFRYRDQAHVLMTQNRHAEAIPLLQEGLRRALAYQRRNGTLMNLDLEFAECYCRTKNLAAVPPFLAALQRRANEERSAPDQALYDYVLAECAWAAGDFDDAQTAFQKVLTLDQNLAKGRARQVQQRATRYAEFMALRNGK